MAITKVQRRNKIKKSIRGKISGTASKPRLSVYRSNKEIYAQLVDDVANVSICSVGSFNNKEVTGSNKTESAALVGKKIAEIASGKGISEVVFDRNGYLYHGRVKALAEGAREGGLKF